jgi:hypothetical protein
MRFRAMAVVLAIVLMPLLLVALTGIEERRVGARLAEAVRDGADEAVSAPSELDAIAHRLDLRIRVLDARGRVITDVDHESGTNPLAGIGQLFFGDDGAPAPSAFDDTLGPVAARSEAQRSAAGGRPRRGPLPDLARLEAPVVQRRAPRGRSRRGAPRVHAGELAPRRARALRPALRDL